MFHVHLINMTHKKASQRFRLMQIDETRNYCFIEEAKQVDLIN